MTHPDLTLLRRVETELLSFDGLMGVWADDLRGHTLEIRAGEPFESASTIKLFILAALYDAAAKGKAALNELLEYRPEHETDGSGVFSALSYGTRMSAKDVASLMIIVSDNICANMLIDYLGLDSINACIAELGCTGTVLHNVIDFTKYDRLGTTTPRDYGGVFRRIASGELISPAASREMWEILSRQRLSAMMTGALPAYYLDPDNYGDHKLFSFATKSGSMDACRNDGGIVATPYGNYVLVMFTKNFSDRMYYPGHPSIVFGSRVSRLLFDQYLTLEGRFER